MTGILGGIIGSTSLKFNFSIINSALQVGGSSLTIPSGAQLSDVLLFVSSGGAVNQNLPTGYTSISQTGDANSASVLIAYKVVSGTIDTVVNGLNSSASRTVNTVTIIRGLATTSTVNATGTPVLVTTSAVNSANPPSVTATANSVIFAICGLQSSTVPTITAPAGYTMIVSGSDTANVNSAAVAYLNQSPTTGTFDPGVFSHISATSNSITIALKAS